MPKLDRICLVDMYREPVTSIMMAMPTSLSERREIQRAAMAQVERMYSPVKTVISCSRSPANMQATASAALLPDGQTRIERCSLSARRRPVRHITAVLMSEERRGG